MLYNLDFLKEGQAFPPKSEAERIKRYHENELLFESEHAEVHKKIYKECFDRITRVVGNFDKIVSYPVILNYQRMLSVKTADLICGEYPAISGTTPDETAELKTLREETGFDESLFPTVIDLSRYGDAIWRMYIDEETGRGRFVNWTPKEWFPVIMDDGTKRITHHVLAWRVNTGSESFPVYRLKVQIHEDGKYTKKEFKMDSAGEHIGQEIFSTEVQTGIEGNAIIHICNMRTSSSIYGHDDYMPIDSIISEILVRISQISEILDAHADPVLYGPSSLLKFDEKTGRHYFEKGKYYAIGDNEKDPKYLTWDGQLDSAFEQLELLIEQLYILSEMGAALLGAMEKTGQAISGTAMRFKMVNPIVKARRMSNGMIIPTKKLLSTLLKINGSEIDSSKISIVWKDGLPNDPRENAEIARLTSGATSVMPLEEAIKEYFEKTPEEAKRWVELIVKDQKVFAEVRGKGSKPIGNKDERVNPEKKGSESGLSNFEGVNN
jgi:hypothetical protein